MLGIIAWQFRLLITLSIAHVINSLNVTVSAKTGHVHTW